MPSTQYNALPGPDFLEAVADQEAANDNDVNAAEFRKRASEWRQDLRVIEQFEQQATPKCQRASEVRSAFPAKHPATLIIGEQGSGKTLLARAVAAQYGTYVEIRDELDLCAPFQLGALLEGGPRAVIVDVEDSTERTLAQIKALVCNPSIQIHRKHQPVRAVATPHFIVCAADREPLLDLDRRFAVVRIG